MTDFIAAQANLILQELVGGYAPEYVFCRTIELLHTVLIYQLLFFLGVGGRGLAWEKQV